MALTTLLDHLNIAAPRLDAVRDRQLTGSFAGSVLPQPREALVPPPASRGPFSRWLHWMVSQRGSFRGSLDTPPTLMPSEPRMSERDALNALARVNAAVLAGQLVADRSRSQGGLRPH